MNRLKVWLYAALFVGAGAGNLYFLSRWLAQRGVEQVDRELRAAAAQVELRTQLLAADAAQLAEGAARAPAVVEALSATGAADASEAVQAAAEAAARAAGADASRGLLVAAAKGAGRATARAAGAKLQVDAALQDLVSAGGARRAGYVQEDATLWYVVAVPAGSGTVAVGVPVGAGFVRSVRASAGVDVTLLLEGKPPQSTIQSPSDLALVASAARSTTDRAVDVGVLAAQRVDSVPLPALPLLFATPPAHRVQALALKGAASVRLALSLPLGPVLAPVAVYQWAIVAALVVLLLIGLVASYLVTEDRTPMVPRELTLAADRIAKGDFTARAPPMAGTLGTVASALNRAAEAAAGAAARPAVEAFPPPAPEPESIDVPFERTPAAAARSAERAPVDGAAAASDVPAEPQRRVWTLEEEEAPAAEPAESDALAAFSEQTPEPLAATAEAVAPEAVAEEVDIAAAAEEEHWQVVYQDFVRAREECGDAPRSLPYERFRQKLVRNRDQLVEKYQCKGVRFQVYVKEGKAALKASPIR